MTPGKFWNERCLYGRVVDNFRHKHQHILNFVFANFFILSPRGFPWRILRRRGCLKTPLATSTATYTTNDIPVTTFMQRFFSTSATMEFLKSIPAVTGRFVTFVMLCAPSGHICFSVSSRLDSRTPHNIHADNGRRFCSSACRTSPTEQRRKPFSIFTTR